VAYWFKHDLAASRSVYKDPYPVLKADSANSIKRWNTGELPSSLVHQPLPVTDEPSKRGSSTSVRADLVTGIISADQRPSVAARGKIRNGVVQHIVTKAPLTADTENASKKDSVSPP
jgi:hypothetical protein